MAEQITVVAGHHPGGKVVLQARRERQHEDELGLRLLGQAHDRVIRLHARVADHWHRPLVLLVIEGVHVAHVVGGIHLRLHVEEVDRMAKMRAQRSGELVQWPEHAREHGVPGARNRLIGIDQVEGNAAVIGVDHGLDRIAQVVAHPLEMLRVGESIGDGVAVEYPEQTPLVDDHVGVPVEPQEGRDLVDPLDDVSVDQHPGFGGEVVGEQHLEIAGVGGD